MRHATFTALGLCAVSTHLFAQQQTTAATEPADEPSSTLGTQEPAGGDPGSRFSLDLSLVYTSDYFFRGIAQKRDSFNLQPAATLGFTLIEEESFSLSLKAGTWSSFSDDRPGGSTGSFSEYWYEHDAYVGASVSVDRITLDALYTWYFSPSADFAEYEDVTLSVSYDDAGLWDEAGRFSLNPSASIAIETRNAASGPDSGVWLGLGLKPSVGLGSWALGSTTLSFPLRLGLSLNDYYQLSDGESETFGYGEVGATLSFDLSEQYGSAAPTVDLGVSYLFLGGVLDDLNGGDSGELVFSAGLSWSF